MDRAARLAELHAAEARAMALLDRIEAERLIAPGRTERAVEKDIYALAEADFGSPSIGTNASAAAAPTRSAPPATTRRC